MHNRCVLLALLLVLSALLLASPSYASEIVGMSPDVPMEDEPGQSVSELPSEPAPVPEEPAGAEPVPTSEIVPTVPDAETTAPLASSPLVEPPLPTESLMPGEELPPVEPSEDMSQVLALLTSINTYLTYLFVFGAFYVVVTIGGLVYKFLRVFF